MKNPLFFAIAVALLLSSCSKKKNVTPSTSGIVYINGTDYPTVVINGQTWTAANYNNASDGGLVYDNGSDTVANGLLYTNAEAEAIALPNGWRIPTEADFNKLLASVGVTNQQASGQPVKELMSTNGWINGSGTNSTGFNALPAGIFADGFTATQSFQWAGTNAVFICSSTYNGPPLCFDINQYGSSNAAGIENYVVKPTDRGSVRFVKDN